MAANLAPIALFAFNRPPHLREALRSLEACELASQSHLTIFIDGPRSADDRPLVEASQSIARERLWCGSVEVVPRTENVGLATSILSGVSRVCREYGRVIVFEDDLVIARSCLQYLNETLDRYEDEERVFQVSGHSFPARGYERSLSSSFLPFVSTLGWGTWSRAWDRCDESMSGSDELDQNRTLRRRFDLDGAYPYYRLLSRLRSRGQLDRSWGIRWYWSVFRHEGLVLYPHQSLISHRGDDGSGTNCARAPRRDEPLFDAGNQVTNRPETIEVDTDYYCEVKRYLAGQNTWVQRGLRYLRRLYALR